MQKQKEAKTFNKDSLRFCGIAESSKKQSRTLVAQPLKASSGQGEGDGSDFAIRKNPCIQAPAPSLKENARGEKGDSNADLSAQGCREIDSVDLGNSQNLQSGLPRRAVGSSRNDGFFRFCVFV